MELFLKNIGKIGEATVRLDGITVIAGENDTGKSTVSRAIFSIFNSCYNIEQRIYDEKLSSLEGIIRATFRSSSRSEQYFASSVARAIMENVEKHKGDPKMLSTFIRDVSFRINNNSKIPLRLGNDVEIDELADELSSYLNVQEEIVFNAVLKNNLDEEFSGQIQNIYAKSESTIQLNANDVCVSIYIKNGIINGTSPYVDLHTKVFYLDNPTILDNMKFFMLVNSKNHQGHLCNCLMEDQNSNIVGEIVANNKLENIYSMISSVCSGDIVKMDSLEYGYRDRENNSTLNIRNLSSGLKTFIILKTLLVNGTIKYGSVILLDEPEIHLHPEWQLLFAEIIVLLHKEFGLRILLNTHSHYFLDAIDVYSQKHHVADKCRFYLASLNGNFATMEDVTGNTEAIYEKLARPLQILENERYQNED